MSETSQTTVDEAGITRTPTGDLVPDQKTDQTGSQDQKTQDTSTAKTKTDDNTKGSDNKSLLNETDDDDKAQGAPEKYEDFKLPEGVTLDAESLTAATALFKDLGLSQEGAQKLVDFHVDSIQKALDAPMNEYTQTRKGWRDEVLADKDLGPKMKEVRSSIAKTIDTVAGKELGAAFRQAMDVTGAGDHPAFVRVFNKIAQAFNEGNHVKGGGPSELGQREPNKPSGKGPSALYPNLPSSG